VGIFFLYTTTITPKATKNKKKGHQLHKKEKKDCYMKKKL